MLLQAHVGTLVSDVFKLSSTVAFGVLGDESYSVVGDGLFSGS